MTGEMFWEVGRYRGLLGMLAWRDIRVRYKQSVLGFAWEFALPVTLIGVSLMTVWQLWLLLPDQIAADPRLLAEIQWRFFDTWSRWAAALMLSPSALLVVVVGVAAIVATALPRRNSGPPSGPPQHV